MKALIVGGGGREHALAWKLKRDDPALELIVAPGNPGIGQIARCAPVPISNAEELVALAVGESVGLTVIGPEAPLAAGLADQLSARGIPTFGPSQAAARIETSKRFAKELMLRAGVPTARATSHSDIDSARRAIRDLGAPVVIKASGLAAGKGVSVCGSIAEADDVAGRMLQDGIFGAAGREVLVEEFMEGEELSVFAVTDGSSFRVMLPAQDHKRLLEGDRGPNTGGMGAYAPVSVADSALEHDVGTMIFGPTLAMLREHDATFRGLLYAGLMLTAEGPKVVEFNCRFGDPETEAILPLLESSLLTPMLEVARGGSLRGAPDFAWRDAAAVTTVLAAAGYPDKPAAGDQIDLPDAPENVTVFHAGTRLDAAGRLVTSGGRVLAVTAVASDFDEARDEARRFASRISFAGKQFRSDIGWRESERRARAS